MKNLPFLRLKMKSVTLCCLSFFILHSSFFTLCKAQNVAINATGNQADPSAMLDVSSTTAGVLIPRMNTAQRNAISSPALGLQVFNTDCNELNYWNGTCWLSMGSLPAPGDITTNMSTALCASVTATYSITAVTGATGYVWSVPAGATINSGRGTTSINVTYGNYSGQICVDAYNSCETSNERCIDVNISPIPPTPGNITGITNVNPGQNNVTYFIGSVPGANIYNWTLPSGGTIITGAGTPLITVNFSCSAVSGNVEVTAGSNCGNSTASLLAVTISPNLAANAGSAAFGGATIGGSPTAIGGVSSYVYSWSPNTNLSSYTVANPTAQCGGSTTTYMVAISDANGCTATSSVVITRNLTVSAGSNMTICNGSSNTIGPATATGGNSNSYTYSWNPTAALSSSTVANPTANPASTSTYTVTATDANGCTATSSMTVTVPILVSTFTNSYAQVNTSITFTPTTTSGVTYSWTFTGGSPGTSTVQNPSVTWSSTGSYNVSLTVTQNGCSSTTTNTVTISPPFSCLAIKNANPSAPSGVYTVNPGSGPIQCYCDMVTDGGGWTMVYQNTFSGTAGTSGDYGLAGPSPTAMSTVWGTFGSNFRAVYGINAESVYSQIGATQMLLTDSGASGYPAVKNWLTFTLTSAQFNTLWNIAGDNSYNITSINGNPYTRVNSNHPHGNGVNQFDLNGANENTIFEYNFFSNNSSEDWNHTWHIWPNGDGCYAACGGAYPVVSGTWYGAVLIR